MRAIACLLSLVATLLLTGAGTVEVELEVRFSETEISVIRDYYREHSAKQSRGKKDKNLPPGIARNLQRGKPLPPGIAKQVLPPALATRLPKTPDGYERIIVAGKILLVEVATQVVHDILTDIVLD